MRINRFIVFLGLIFIIGLLKWVGLSSYYQYVLKFDAINIGSKISIGGMLNIGATYCTIFALIPLCLIGLIVLITGKQVNYLPKVFWQLYGVVVVFGFFYGIYQHSELESKIQQKGYVECKDERVISSKYSSRTYALTLEECKDN